MLITLLQDIKFSSTVSIDKIMINKIQFDSRKIQPGDIFVAVKGYETDGHKFIEKAYQKGAVAAIVENPISLEIPQVIVDDSRSILADLSYKLYEKEIVKLKLAGITGTNGKTTIGYLVQHILKSNSVPSALTGTIEYIIGEKKENAWNTTPESTDLFKMLAEAVKNGDKAAVMEVSSHALYLKRVNNLQFDVSVFSNLSRDHLDFHKDMDDYFFQKKKLFEQLKAGGTAVINIDDPYGQRLAVQLRNDVKIIKVGYNDTADWKILSFKSTIDKLQIDLEIANNKVTFLSPLIGEFNVYNIIQAAAAASVFGITIDQINDSLNSFTNVPGRLEKILLNNKALAVIDYSHTPDSLEKALSILRELTQNRLIVVFGCGGDRDKGKRPIMGQVAQQNADIVFVTSDNPRTENDEKIIDDIFMGLTPNDSTFRIRDRREAIKSAVKMSESGDIVLIAGKGHEQYQQIGMKKYDFNERQIILDSQL